MMTVITVIYPEIFHVPLPLSLLRVSSLLTWNEVISFPADFSASLVSAQATAHIQIHI